MTDFKVLKRFGIILYLGSLTLAWILYDWKLVLILFLLSWAMGVNDELTK